MGIQVDPYYGINDPDERLYIKVANFGNEDVKITPGAAVFNIEFSSVEEAEEPDPPKMGTWNRVLLSLEYHDRIDWTHMARVQTQSLEIERSTWRVLDSIRDNQQSVVLFGVFLVSITILVVFIGVILNVKNTPSWVTDGGWVALLVLCIIAVIGILIFGCFSAVGFWHTVRHPPGERHSRKVSPDRSFPSED